MKWVALTGCVLLLGAAVVFYGDLAQGKTGPINVTVTLATSASVALPPEGRRSDLVHESWRVNDRQGTRIGRMLLSCHWVVRRARFCNGEIKLPLGTIEVQGASPSRFSGEYAVIGGTGVYEAGGGTMSFVSIGARKGVLLVTITT